MAWNTINTIQGEGAEGLVYDLRQIYAKDLVGETLKAIRLARISENYPVWYHLLKRDLLTEISQKLDDEELTKIKNKIDEVKRIIMINVLAYQKKTTDGLQHEAVETALCELEMMMRKLMEEHNMFGNFNDDEGLL